MNESKNVWINARSVWIVLSALFSIIMACKLGDVLNNANHTISALIDIFAILAAVLVAVISIVGDPSMLLPGNWRIAAEHAQDMQKKLSIYSVLFLVYIITLISLILVQIQSDNTNIHIPYAARSALGLSTFSLLLSIPLPFSLMSIQKERMDEVVKCRKDRK